MKKSVGIFCLFVVSLTAHSMSMKAEVVGIRSHIELLDTNGRIRPIENNVVSIKIESPLSLLNSARGASQEKRLTITDSKGSFVFVIPKLSQNESQIVTRSAENQQRADLSMNVQDVFSFTSKPYETIVSCFEARNDNSSASVPQAPGGILDATRPLIKMGFQKVVAQERYTYEKRVIELRSGSSTLVIRSADQPRNEVIVLKKLSDCI